LDTPDIAQVREIANRCEGWLTDSEGELLYTLARRCTGAGSIVEIGSWKGRSTTWLAYGSKCGSGVPVHAVDPHTGSPNLQRLFGPDIWTYDAFLENIAAASIADIVIPHVQTSADAAAAITEPVELVFIDGDHRYEHVRQDAALWLPKIVAGGFIAFHDTDASDFVGPGPKRVVDELLRRSSHLTDPGVVDSIAYARTLARNTVIDRVRNTIVWRVRQLRGA
jgi:MMP 1-O-methyltransferase